MAAALKWTSLSKPQKIGVFVIALLIILAIAAWLALILLRPSYPTADELTAQAKAQASLTGGAKAYTARCAYCHENGFAPSITGRQMDAGTLLSFVRMGAGNMPAFPKTAVSDADINAITEYVNGQPVKDVVE